MRWPRQTAVRLIGARIVTSGSLDAGRSRFFPAFPHSVPCRLRALSVLKAASYVFSIRVVNSYLFCASCLRMFSLSFELHMPRVHKHVQCTSSPIINIIVIRRKYGNSSMAEKKPSQNVSARA